MQHRLKRYYLNIADKDIEAGGVDETLEFEGVNIYRVVPLEFGGVIAFEPDYIHCYRRRIKTKVISKKLRNQMKVTSICAIDSYDPFTKRTKEGKTLMRYLFATESGEMYMLGFYLEMVHLISGVTQINPAEAA